MTTRDERAGVELLEAAGEDGRTLLVAARMDWTRRVPHCPDWDAAGLVRHMGGILTWMDAVVTGGQRVSRRGLDPAPESLADLAPWYIDHLDRTLAVLGSADAESRCWTFSTVGDEQVGWWRRRLAVEVAIHRWDAQHALHRGSGAAPQPVDGEVAAAGIEEFMTEFLPGLFTQEQVSGLSGTLHLHATDGPSEWWTDLDHPGVAIAEHRKGDTAVRGTRSDLLLWLTNRVTTQPLDIVGDGAVLERWPQLNR